MSTPPNANDAYTAALANLTADQIAANNAFIADSAVMIANAIALGYYWTTLTTTKYCDIQSLQTYYTGLGYQLYYLDLPNPNGNIFSPAELFGEFYFDYWLNYRNVPRGAENPQRIRISWYPPYVNPYPYP